MSEFDVSHAKTFNMDVPLNNFKLRTKKFLERQLTQSDLNEIKYEDEPREYLFPGTLVKIAYYGGGSYQIAVYKKDGKYKFLVKEAEISPKKKE